MNGASFCADVSLAVELAALEDDVVVDFGANPPCPKFGTKRDKSYEASKF
jgi:hypothetical protein